MKAAQIKEYGGPEVLVTVSDAPKPEIAPNQVLVEVRAAGVNPFDLKVRQGLVPSGLKFPATLGGDFAGVVAAVGSDVTHVKLGDEVYGQAKALSGQGSFAEYTPVPADFVGLKPGNTSFAEAASLPLAGVSAYQALVETLELKSGQKILIHGGAGGIGSLAIQLAKHLGAQVATTVSSGDQDYVRSLGADVVIDYKTQKFQDELKDFYAVFDTIGGETQAESFKVLRPGGAIVSMVGQPDEALAKQYQVTATGQATKLNPERIAALTKLVEDGVIKPEVDKTFPLEQAGVALGYLQQGAHRGKVVIVIKEG